MRTSSRVGAALAAAALFVPMGTAVAGPYVGLFGGFHGFARDGVFELTGEEPGTVFVGGLRLGYDIFSFLGVEAELGLIPGSTQPSDYSFLTMPWRINVVAYGDTPWSVRPFAVIGAGGLTGLSGVKTTAGEAHAGAGVLWSVTENLGIRLEGRAVLVPRNEQSEFPDWEALLGVAFKFGTPAEAAVAATPGEPTPEPARPPADSDRDGIVDSSDRCPNEPGPSENDGCPDADSDGDGVVDRLDQCKNQKGSAEDKGCPPRDTDSDGILDRDDKCPKEPETKNSYQDADGCPDQVPEQLKRFTGSIEGIQFKTGSAQLLRTSMTLLDKAAAVLKQYPDLNVTIAGHTDNVGDADKNQALSQARADSVKQYLIKKGIAESRLRAVGYGPSRPVADNATPEGRQKNRRVEFELNQ